jgi:hypothetical protein
MPKKEKAMTQDELNAQFFKRIEDLEKKVDSLKGAGDLPKKVAEHEAQLRAIGAPKL